MITIVTSRNFIICEAINHITLQSEPERVGTQLVNFYTIDIDFQPQSRNNQSATPNSPFGGRGEERGFVRIKVRGEKSALRLFKELVTQIREQLPDATYLDKMVENILSGKIEEIYDESSTQTSSGARQAKREREKAIRRAKSRARGSQR
jgi:hypothetical protein